ncbi:MAG: redoxin family protein [Nitrospirales bacterium]|nr:peroxiredoxin [Nitrospirales bacterium]
MNQRVPTPSKQALFLAVMCLLTSGIFILAGAPLATGKSFSIEKGQPIPSVTVLGKQGETVNLDTLKGQVTLISIVPQLNTPVCDEQTHRFSEKNGGLDKVMTFVTLSTNTYDDQQTFAAKAGIHNMTFLSDAPDYHFGTATGLLLEQLSILHRAVLVLDTNGIIRYVEQVPLGQLPDFDRALRVSRTLLPTTSRGVMP